ncbi:MAG: glycerol kinase GlpK [Alphaproteobacteria bacterium]|nr:glycerol kinase GlpK [Alphaproteobacteria bacterium]
MPYLLAIDQGTTSSRAMVFDPAGGPLSTAQEALTAHFPRPGWVEQDAEEIWRTTLASCRAVLARHDVGAVAAIGISNQRETTVLWERDSGRPLYPAIVWQDRRGAEACRKLRAVGAEELITARTGLRADSYFSATKLAWLLGVIPGARRRAEEGKLAFGTIDTFLLWRLTGGRVHATDATNASRTLLFDIHRQHWDSELLALFGIPRAVLPDVLDSAQHFGTSDPVVLGQALPIAGIAGDQQAAAIGQACLHPGMAKATYGTGGFVLVNTGVRPARSRHGLLTTIAYRLDGQTTYAIEGSIFNAGTAVKWLRDALGVIPDASMTAALAGGLPDNRGVYLVPAFTGLGAPYWEPEARGAIFGLTRDTGPAELARAALEAVGYQTRDLFEALGGDGVARPIVLRVDGGMADNDWLLQFLADMLEVPIERPASVESAAQGVAYLAGLTVGMFASPAAIVADWRAARRFEPAMSAAERAALWAGWQRALARVRE